MRRFVGVWLLIASVYVLGRTAVSLVGFQRLDLRFSTFLEVLFAPALQAALFCTVLAPSGRLRPALREAARSREVAIVAAANVLLVALGALIGADSWAERAVPLAAGLQAGLAALLLLTLTFGTAQSRGARALLIVGALGLGAWCAETFAGRLASLPDRVAAGLPQALRWLTVYGGIFALFLALVLSLGRALERRSMASGALLELAAAFALVAAAVVVPNLFLRPIVLEPWRTVARSCALLAAGSILMAALAARSAARRSPADALAGAEGV